jgi:hypothetical protein
MTAFCAKQTYATKKTENFRLRPELMRMMLRTHAGATHESDALKSGALQKAISAFVEKFKPEASYFVESGKRTAFFVFHMEDSLQCPEIAEAFFDTGCDIHLSPCMTSDDLQKGLEVAGLTARG